MNSGAQGRSLCYSPHAGHQTPKLHHSEFVPGSPFPAQLRPAGASCITIVSFLPKLSASIALPVLAVIVVIWPRLIIQLDPCGLASYSLDFMSRLRDNLSSG